MRDVTISIARSTRVLHTFVFIVSGADNTPNVLNIPPESSDELVNSVVSLLASATHTREFSFYPPVPDDWLGTECADGLEAFCLFCHQNILSAPR